jgi:p-hydroxybenzoate 3-monooxygenase
MDQAGVESAIEQTAVVIVGAGVAGLTLATFLHKSGVACIVLERRNRSYIEARQRAGFLEPRAVKMFERWEMEALLPEGPIAQHGEIRINGVARPFGSVGDDAEQGRFCTQQQLVSNLLRELIDEVDGDVRFDVTEMSILNKESDQPRVSYSDASGHHKIVCDYIVGCDGGHSASRNTIPHGVLTKYSYEFGYAWLAALVTAAPISGQAIMAVSDHGFAAQITRGPNRSRVYLQCDVSDCPQDWPAERIWKELRLRLGEESIPDADVLSRDVIPLRSVVYEPMQYRNLFLVGDAAHLVPPTGAKGMNLALHDVDVISRALLRALRDGDGTLLESYSDEALPDVWKEQEFSVSMTDLMHDSGDPKQHGTFRQRIARTRIEQFLAAAKH